MTTPAIGANILLIGATSYLFLLWWTNSLRGSIATTYIIIMTIIVGILHKFDYLFLGFIFMLFSMGILVWRVIPSSMKDKWRKEDV